MSLWNVWKRRKQRPIRSRPAARFQRLWLEQLEDRCVPATFTVMNTADSGPGSLRDAVASANADFASTGTPEIIQFDPHLTGQTILLETADPANVAGPSALEITGNITINGISTGTGVTIARDPSASTTFRLFDVQADASLTLNNLTLLGGVAQGFAGGEGGGGGSAGLGGAIFVGGDTGATPPSTSSTSSISSPRGPATLAVFGCTFAGNMAIGGAGGAAALFNGGGGGGGLGGDGQAGGSLPGTGGPPNGGGVGANGGFGGGGGGADDTTAGIGGFGGGGGGVSFSSGGMGGFGGGGGGGGQISTTSDGAVFGGGGLGGFGGGNGGAGAGSSIGFGGGGAALGGGIFNNGGTVVITNSTFAGNKPGTIFPNSGNMAASFGDNTVTAGADGDGHTTAMALGAAIFSLNGSLQLVNDTIYDRIPPSGSGSSGHGLFTGGSTGPSTGNGAGPATSGSGEDVYVLQTPQPLSALASVSLTNNILSALTLNAINASGNSVTGPATSGVRNLIVNSQALGTASIPSGLISASAAPDLSPLSTLNGGPTPTMILEAIDLNVLEQGASGSGVPTTDQRGVARPSGAIDLGAVQITTVVTTQEPVQLTGLDQLLFFVTGVNGFVLVSVIDMTTGQLFPIAFGFINLNAPFAFLGQLNTSGGPGVSVTQLTSTLGGLTSGKTPPSAALGTAANQTPGTLTFNVVSGMIGGIQLSVTVNAQQQQPFFPPEFLVTAPFMETTPAGTFSSVTSGLFLPFFLFGGGT
jgi:hypothetical protein